MGSNPTAGTPPHARAFGLLPRGDEQLPGTVQGVALGSRASSSTAHAPLQRVEHSLGDQTTEGARACHGLAPTLAKITVKG